MTRFLCFPGYFLVNMYAKTARIIGLQDFWITVNEKAF